MKFIDELKFNIRAGRGGDGVVQFHREKFKPRGGPSGGDGGNGGDVFVRAVRDSSLLSKYANNQNFAAENGVAGSKNSMHGRNGEDLIIDLPLGSFVTNLDTEETFDLINDGESVLILKGGHGGLGNEHFKSSVNRTPQEFTRGKVGQNARFSIELRIIADAGLMGLPNAGKSSLLNELTNANSKVGDYEFTTLSPHLGAMYGYILADIPGLIEGASDGKGLGHKFLRHILRTKILLHCVSMENEDVMESYNLIRREITDYSEELGDKLEIVVLTKSDLVEKSELTAILKKFKAMKKEVYVTSVYDDESVKNLRDFLIKKFKTFEV